MLTLEITSRHNSRKTHGRGGMHSKRLINAGLKILKTFDILIFHYPTDAAFDKCSVELLL